MARLELPFTISFLLHLLVLLTMGRLSPPGGAPAVDITPLELIDVSDVIETEVQVSAPEKEETPEEAGEVEKEEPEKIIEAPEEAPVVEETPELEEVPVEKETPELEIEKEVESFEPLQEEAPATEAETVEAVVEEVDAMAEPEEDAAPEIGPEDRLYESLYSDMEPQGPFEAEVEKEPPEPAEASEPVEEADVSAALPAFEVPEMEPVEEPAANRRVFTPFKAEMDDVVIGGLEETAQGASEAAFSQKVLPAVETEKDSESESSDEKDVDDGTAVPSNLRGGPRRDYFESRGADGEEGRPPGHASKGGGATDEMAAFISLVRHRIEKEKFYPGWARRRGYEGTVGVRFVILPDGKVEGIEVVRPCHCEILNRAACMAIEKAAPFGPVPDSADQKGLIMEIDISYRLR